MSTELLTQIEILKTDMGKIQRQLFDALVEKRTYQNMVKEIVDKLIQEVKVSDTNRC